jgi:hypothetical protein
VKKDSAVARLEESLKRNKANAIANGASNMELAHNLHKFNAPGLIAERSSADQGGLVREIDKRQCEIDRDCPGWEVNRVQPLREKL